MILVKLILIYLQLSRLKTLKKHHEESSAFQKKFKENVIKMQTAFDDACNPFMDQTPELINIKTNYHPLPQIPITLRG